MKRSTQQREQTYKLVINDLPINAVYLAMFLFFGVVSASVMMIFFAPNANEAQRIKFSQDVSAAAFLKGQTSISATSQHLSKMNQEVSFSLFFKSTDAVNTLRKQDVKIKVQVQGRNRETDPYVDIWNENVEHTRFLDCSTSGQSYFCAPLVVFRERFITHNYYSVKVTVTNLADLYQMGILDDVLEGQFDFANQKYTIFESILRAQFFSMSVILFVFYAWFLLSRQSWSYCKTEQKWIVVLLFFLMLYNNPLFIADWLADNFFFPLLNILFIATFACLLILFVMVIAHSVVVKPRDRRFFWFYAPKFAVVVVNWLLIVLTLSWERLNQRTDPSYDLTEVPFFGGARVGVMLLTILCALMIAYYVTRALSDLSRLGITYEIRFKYFWILTALVMIATAVDYATVFLADYVNNAAQYLSFFPLYNFYCVTLAIFFLPSNKPEDDAQERLASNTLQLDDDDMIVSKSKEMGDLSNDNVVQIDLGVIDDDAPVEKKPEQAVQQ